MGLLKISSKKREIVVLKDKAILSKEDGGISQEIKAFLELQGISNNKIFLNIPRYNVIARLLRLPSTDEEEIAKIIKTESLKYIPFGDDEIISSYRIIETLDDGYSSVLLAIVLGASVKRTINILKMAGLPNVEFISLGCETLFLWYQAARKEDSKGNVLIVNIDANYVDINIIEANKLKFTRGIHYGVGELLTSGDLLNELRISIVAYEKESNKKVEEIVMTGISDSVKGYEAFLVNELKLPVKIIEQFNNMPVKEGVQNVPGKASFIGILGLSLGFNEAQINLLPDDIVRDNRRREWQNDFTLTIVLSVLILLVTSVDVAKKLHDKTAYLARINTEVERISPSIVKAKKMLNYIKIIKEETGNKLAAIDIISELYKLTPAGISLNRIDYEADKSLSVTGNADNLEEALKYVDILGSSPYFKGAKIKNASKHESAVSDTAVFEITCSWSKAGNK